MRDALAELSQLARELLPNSTSCANASPLAAPTTSAPTTTRTLRAQLERDASRIDTLERALARARDSAADAARTHSASLREVRDIMALDGRIAREKLERALVDADAREAETRRALRDAEDTVDAVGMERDSLAKELVRLRAEVDLWRARCEEAYVKADASEERARRVRNGDLLSALRDRVVELQNELKMEKLAGDQARKVFEKRIFAKDVEVMCIRDRARELGMCMELLDDLSRT